MTKSKAQRIRELYAEGRKPKEIAVIVGCRKEYVRSVKQRGAAGNDRSAAQIRYERSEKGRKAASGRFKKRYRADPAFRQHKVDYSRAWKRRQREARANV